jgi:hypothetical protein
MRLESEDEKIRDISPSQIRLPSELKEKIRVAAKKNRHSMSAEIVARLEESFRTDDYSPPPGTVHTVTISKESYEAMERFMEELRKSNIDLSKAKEGKPLRFREDDGDDLT